MNEKELLSVLDMSEDEQRLWLCAADCKYFDITRKAAISNGSLSLADLAFKLRDEALQENATNWQRAMDLVFVTVNPRYKSEYKLSRWAAVTYWFSHVSKPIHWIIAALIVKDKRE